MGLMHPARRPDRHDPVDAEAAPADRRRRQGPAPRLRRQGHLLDIAGLPNLTLTVPGRSAGIARTTPLLCVPDGDTWLIAGSYFGGPKMPLWVGNLRAADGAARVEFGGRRSPVTATELEGAERAAAWQVDARTWPNYAKYEERTDRVIPVFRLTPRLTPSG